MMMILVDWHTLSQNNEHVRKETSKEKRLDPEKKRQNVGLKQKAEDKGKKAKEEKKKARFHGKFDKTL